MPVKNLKSQTKPMEATLQKYLSSELPSSAKQEMAEVDRSLKKYMVKGCRFRASRPRG
jgi:hypothetical protein